MKFGIEDADFELILQHIRSNLGQSTKPELFIFGSRAKGTHRNFSDIDLLFKARKYDKKALSQLDFEELDTPYKVDFVLDEDLYSKYRADVYDSMKMIKI